MGTIQPAADPGRGLKLSEVRYNRDVALGETNINVVVRCRGRNEREVRENTPVVVSTNGVKGTTVELAMGPRAPGDLTFSFDKVFSPAADQAMIFNEVAAPILEEVYHSYPDVLVCGLTCSVGPRGLQLHHLCLWADRNWQNVHDVRRYL